MHFRILKLLTNGGGPAKMNAKVGMKFSLWGGDIYGTNTDVTDSKLLFQDWYGGEWDKPSKVSFTLTKINKGTRITLHHTDIPDKEFDDIADGWKRYYLGPLKQFLEK
jgi:activator of HSP90 ATPase